MTDKFRTALEDLTPDRTMVANLANRAVARATRRRAFGRTAFGLAAVGAVLAVSLVAVPMVTHRHTASLDAAQAAGDQSAGQVTSPPSAGPVTNTGSALPPPTPRYAILSYIQYTHDPSDPAYAWDPDSHRYIKTGHTLVRPSPDGRWGLVGPYPSNELSVARWSDAVHGRNLTRLSAQGTALWAPEGATLVVVNRAGHTTSYVDPATGTTHTVPWPAAVTKNARKLLASAPGYHGQVVLWSRTPLGALVQTVDRQGRLVGSSDVLDVNSAGPEGLDDPQVHPTVSPDGRYVVPVPGALYDLRTHRYTTFDDPTGINGVSAGFDNGWYDGGHLIQTGASGRSAKGNLPITMSTYDTSGHLVHSLPLTALPGFGPGRTDAFLARITPATEGALTF